jgi:hypothetical protein
LSMKLEDRLKRLEKKAGGREGCRCAVRPVVAIYPEDPARETPEEATCGKCGGVYAVDVVRIVWTEGAQ